jgi:hypothetical protein
MLSMKNTNVSSVKCCTASGIKPRAEATFSSFSPLIFGDRSSFDTACLVMPPSLWPNAACESPITVRSLSTFLPVSHLLFHFSFVFVFAGRKFCFFPFAFQQPFIQLNDLVKRILSALEIISIGSCLVVHVLNMEDESFLAGIFDSFRDDESLCYKRQIIIFRIYLILISQNATSRLNK